MPIALVDAFAKSEILQVLLMAVLFGFALHRLGERGTLVFDMVEKTLHVLLTIPWAWSCRPAARSTWAAQPSA